MRLISVLFLSFVCIGSFGCGVKKCTSDEECRGNTFCNYETGACDPVGNGAGGGAGENGRLTMTASSLSAAVGELIFIRVEVPTRFGSPVRGQRVDFVSSEGPASLNTTFGTSDFEGLVVVVYEPRSTGTQTVTATSNGLVERLTFMIGGLPVSGADSTFVATPDVVIADGISAATLTLTARDEFGNPVTGRQVHLSATGNGNTLSEPDGITDGAGVFVSSITSTVAEPKYVTASLGTNLFTIVEFITPVPVSPTLSTLTVTPSSVLANGIDAATATVTARDPQGNPIDGANVTLTYGGVATVLPPSATTANGGLATFTLTSTTTTTGLLTATVSGLPIASTPSLTFSSLAQPLSVFVEGLTGTGLVLSTPGQANLAIAPGGADLRTFASPVSLGTIYSVRVLTQPTGQVCGVENGEGTMTNAGLIVRLTCRSPWRAVSVGNGFTIALKLDGTLWSFGINDTGQLGDGTLLPRTDPVRIGTATTWSQIFAGDVHSLAIRDDGSLWAWGNNSGGRLGDGTTTQPLAPVQIGTATNWAAATASGSGFSFALRTDGTLWGWGSNSSGQLGDGTTVAKLVPTRIGTASDWASISSGYLFSVARKTDGTLWGWGQAGSLCETPAINRTSPIQIGVGGRFRSAAAGLIHVLAVHLDGSLWSCGLNNAGQVGHYDTNVFTRIGTGSDWLNVFAGDQVSFAVKQNGNLWGWGRNDRGQVGEPNPVHFDPVLVSGAPNWVAVSSNGNKGAAVRQDNTLWEWGDGTGGRPVLRPTPMTSLDWSRASTRSSHSHAVKNDGTRWAWGRNTVHQFGDGTTQPLPSLVPKQKGALTTWSQNSPGLEHGIGLQTDGTLWGWGVNTVGQLGDGSAVASRHLPVRLGTDSSWSSLSVGSDYGLAIRLDGSLWAWGSGASGKLGTGGGANLLSQTRVGTENDWQSMAAWERHTLAIKTDGTLWAWGANDSGQLGDGTAVQKPDPTRVGAATNWVMAAAGTSHSLALRQDGTLWAWGTNVGDGTATPSPTPVRVGTDSNWAKVFAGLNISLAIKQDGSLWAWGENSTGWLGTGLPATVLSPVRIGTASNWTSVSAGTNAILGIRADGSLWSWGPNALAEAGHSVYSVPMMLR